MLLEDELQPLPPTQARRVYKRRYRPRRRAQPFRSVALASVHRLRYDVDENHARCRQRHRQQRAVLMMSLGQETNRP
jgi:hypothetical protein